MQSYIYIVGTYLVVGTKISGPQLFEGKSALQIFPSLQKVFPWFVPSRYVCRCNTKFCVSYGDIVCFKKFCLVKIRFTQYISDSLWVHCVFQTVWLVKTRFTQYISDSLLGTLRISNSLACKDSFYTIYFTQLMETYHLFFGSSWCSNSYHHKNKLNDSRINDLLLFLFTLFLILHVWLFACQIFSNIENIFDRIYF